MIFQIIRIFLWLGQVSYIILYFVCLGINWTVLQHLARVNSSSHNLFAQLIPFCDYYYCIVLYKSCFLRFVIQSTSDDWLEIWPWNLRLSKNKSHFEISYSILGIYIRHFWSICLGTVQCTLLTLGAPRASPTIAKKTIVVFILSVFHWITMKSPQESQL